MSEMKECCGIEDYLLCRCAEFDAIHANNSRLESDNYDLRAKLSSLNEALIAAEAKVLSLTKERDLWKAQSEFESEHREKYRGRVAALTAKVAQMQGVVEAARKAARCYDDVGSSMHTELNDSLAKYDGPPDFSRLTPEPEGKPCGICDGNRFIFLGGRGVDCPGCPPSPGKGD